MDGVGWCGWAALVVMGACAVVVVAAPVYLTWRTRRAKFDI